MLLDELELPIELLELEELELLQEELDELNELEELLLELEELLLELEELELLLQELDELQEELQELEPVPVFSVGWVIKEDKDCIVVVSTVLRSEGTGFGEICILKGTIQKRWRLRDPSSQSR